MNNSVIRLDDLAIHTGTIAYARRYPTGDVAITFASSLDALWLRGENGPRFWSQWCAGPDLAMTIEDTKPAVPASVPGEQTADQEGGAA